VLLEVNEDEWQLQYCGYCRWLLIALMCEFEAFVRPSGCRRVPGPVDSLNVVGALSLGRSSPVTECVHLYLAEH